MFLTDQEADLFDGSIGIMSRMHEKLMNVPVIDARRHIKELDDKTQNKYRRKDRKDTYFFDIVAEDSISIGDDSLGFLALNQKIVGEGGIIITEECGRVPVDSDIKPKTSVIISDPVDGSAIVEQIIRKHSRAKDRNEKMSHILKRHLNDVGYDAARRQAPNSSMTLLKDNQIKYTIVVNLVTKDMYIASPEGIYMGDIDTATGRKDCNTPVKFHDDENINMLCYTKRGRYEQNRMGTHLRFFPIHKSSKARIGPIGPMRITQLIDYGKGDRASVGIVAHNGEKIQEFLPTISIALFSKGQLEAYKLYCDPEYTQQRAGKGMTPELANSIFSDGLIVNTGVNDSFLNFHGYPSEFRDTTAIISSSNDAAKTYLMGMANREYCTRII